MIATRFDIVHLVVHSVVVTALACAIVYDLLTSVVRVTSKLLSSLKPKADYHHIARMEKEIYGKQITYPPGVIQPVRYEGQIDQMLRELE